MVDLAKFLESDDPSLRVSAAADLLAPLRPRLVPDQVSPEVIEKAIAVLLRGACDRASTKVDLAIDALSRADPEMVGRALYDDLVMGVRYDVGRLGRCQSAEVLCHVKDAVRRSVDRRLAHDHLLALAAEGADAESRGFIIRMLVECRPSILNDLTGSARAMAYDQLLALIREGADEAIVGSLVRLVLESRLSVLKASSGSSGDDVSIAAAISCALRSCTSRESLTALLYAIGKNLEASQLEAIARVTYERSMSPTERRYSDDVCACLVDAIGSVGTYATGPDYSGLPGYSKIPKKAMFLFLLGALLSLCDGEAAVEGLKRIVVHEIRNELGLSVQELSQMGDHPIANGVLLSAAKALGPTAFGSFCGKLLGQIPLPASAFFSLGSERELLDLALQFYRGDRTTLRVALTYLEADSFSRFCEQFLTANPSAANEADLRQLAAMNDGQVTRYDDSYSGHFTRRSVETVSFAKIRSLAGAELTRRMGGRVQ